MTPDEECAGTGREASLGSMHRCCWCEVKRIIVDANGVPDSGTREGESCSTVGNVKLMTVQVNLP